MLKKFLKNQRGLTLVELLAVVVIIGIISAIATVSIGNVIERTREDAIHSDALQILNAAELYLAQGGTLPVTVNALDEDEAPISDSADYLQLLTSVGSFTYFTVDGDAGALELTGEAVNGAVTINFDSATLADILNSRDSREDNAGVSSDR